MDERLCQHFVFIFSLSRQRWGQMTIWPHLHEPKVGPWPRWPPPLRPPVQHFDTLPENFDFLTLKVTPPGHQVVFFKVREPVKDTSKIQTL